MTRKIPGSSLEDSPLATRDHDNAILDSATSYIDSDKFYIHVCSLACQTDTITASRFLEGRWVGKELQFVRFADSGRTSSWKY